MTSRSTKLATTFNWFDGKSIKSKHSDIKVNQVYCWVNTKDNQIILVSKTGDKWQFPGGHPEKGESMIETCTRELLEETGIDVSEHSERLRFFGYYLVQEPDENNAKFISILQVRFVLQIDKNSSDLTLIPQEKVTEIKSERINFVKSFSIEDAIDKIPWLKESKELQAFKKETRGIKDQYIK